MKSQSIQMKKIFAILLTLTFLVSCSSTKKQTSSESSSNYNITSSDNDDSFESSSVSTIISSSATDSNNISESGGNSMTSKINSSSSKSSSSSHTSIPEVFTGKTYTIDFEKYYTENSSIFNKAFNSVLNETKLISAKHKADGSDYRIIVDLKKRQYTLSTSINFVNVSNIVFNGNGSTFIFNKVVSAFDCNKASNITLQDLTVDYNPLHFTQGVITKIEENGKFIEIEVDKGYPADADFLNRSGCNAIFIDSKTDSFRANTRDSFAPTLVTKIGDNKLRLNIGWAVTEKINSSSATIKIGDLMALGPNGPRCIALSYCKKMSFVNINIYGGYGGILEWYGEGGNVYRNVKVTPGPMPSGATRQRLISVNSDVLHSASVKKGALLENCLFEKQFDDGINIHGFYGYIVKKIDSKTYIMSPKYEGIVDPGDNVELTNGGSYGLISKTKVTSVSKYNDDSDSLKSVVKQVWNGKHPPANAKMLYKVVFDSNQNLNVGDVLNSTDKVGEGAIIRNSTFKNNRSRGIVLKSYNCLIEGNTIENTGYSGIYISSELGYWGESDFVHDVIIRNNKIKDSCTSINSRISSCVEMGAITVSVGYPLTFVGLYDTERNSNIKIHNNTISDSYVYGVFCTNSSNVDISNNTIKNCFREGPCNAGERFIIRNVNSIIYVAMSSNVSVTNNTFAYNKYTTTGVAKGDGVVGLVMSSNK